MLIKIITATASETPPPQYTIPFVINTIPTTINPSIIGRRKASRNDFAVVVILFPGNDPCQSG